MFKKKIYFLYIFSFLIVLNSYTSKGTGNLRSELIGFIKFQEEHDKIPEFRFFFEGKETVNNSDGIYSFPLDTKEPFEKFYILLCKSYKINMEKLNTINNLSISPDKNYRYFKFKKNFSGQWCYKEKKLDKKFFIVPKNCIIMTINPKYVSNIEPWNIKLSDNFVKLPQIVLKTDLDFNKLKREAAKSLLYSLDTNLFHEQVRDKIKKEKDNVTLALKD